MTQKSLICIPHYNDLKIQKIDSSPGIALSACSCLSLIAGSGFLPRFIHKVEINAGKYEITHISPLLLTTQKSEIEINSLKFPGHYKYWTSFQAKTKDGKIKFFCWDVAEISKKNYQAFVRAAPNAGKDWQKVAQAEIDFEIEKIKLRRLPKEQEDKEIRKVYKTMGRTTMQKYGSKK